jgi:hypothetical protein
MSPDRKRRQEKVVAAKALLIVRAEVADPADRPHFDRWYNVEHLRDALATFQADRAWRSWSKIHPTSHCAFYEFSEVAAAHAALQSDGTKLLIAKFDQTWGNRVTRTRDIVQVVQRLPSSN